MAASLDGDMYRTILTLTCDLVSGPPGVLGIWREWLFIFREMGSTGNYFRGAREQANNFGDIGNLAKKAKKKKKIRKSLHFVCFFKNFFCFRTPL